MKQSDLIENVAIGAAKPANRTAANVMRGGENYNTLLNAQKLKEVGDTKIRPEFRTLPHSFSEALAFKKLVGKRLGNFRVLGLSIERPKRYVAQCLCGTYTFRTSKALLRESEDDLCLNCFVTKARTKGKFEITPHDIFEKPDYKTTGKSPSEIHAMSDLIGRKTGTITVLGLSNDRHNKWVCMCDCGRYLFRTAKYIRLKHDACCSVCELKKL